jgi:hypothetical protein
MQARARTFTHVGGNLGLTEYACSRPFPGI